MRVRIDGDKIFAIILAVGFLFLTIVLPMVLTRDQVKTYEIFSDQDFKKYRFEGEGTEQNPFLIENLSIVNGMKRAINISNTNSYFIIRNNFLSYNLLSAISIKSIAPGTAKIYNNTCIGHSTEGIKIVSSDFVEITNNTCLDNKIGIGIYDSNNCTVENNQLLKSQPVSEQEPSSSSGLIIEKSNSTSITNNYIRNPATGIEIENSNNCIMVNNDVTRTFTNGIIMRSSSYCTLQNSVSERSKYNGINLYDAHFNILENCIASDNLQGITLHSSSFNQLSFNQLIDNVIGIQLSESSNGNIITMNELLNNTEEGVNILSGSNSIIHHNSFYGNNEGETSQARDDGIDNLWYEDVTSEGNYWSSWNSSLPYELLGSANNTDPFPLSDPIFLLLKQYSVFSFIPIVEHFFFLCI